MSQQGPETMAGSPGAGRRRSLLVFLPLAVVLALAVLFFLRLFAGDVSRVPSALIGKPVPAFVLPPVEGMKDLSGLSAEDLRQGHVTLVNIFASWCVPCHQEHPILQAIAADERLKAKGLRIVGIAYKDEPENTRRFLGRGGNPYSLIGMDRTGRVAIDWGVYGVPETFIVKGDGTIAYKFIGPMSEAAFREMVLPEIEKAGR
jgi:cytochrome c biogenesis protein CcmG/thiol:disulfide interchange protein DsbE